MPGIQVRQHEHIEGAMRRFKRACDKASMLAEMRKREFYEKPSEERRRKKSLAVKRAKRVARG